MRAFFLDFTDIHAADRVSDGRCDLTRYVRMGQNIAFPHPPSLDCTFKGAGEMCDKLPLHLLFFVTIAGAFCDFGRVGVEE